jgi:hypothetical protein
VSRKNKKKNRCLSIVQRPLKKYSLKRTMMKGLEKQTNECIALFFSARDDLSQTAPLLVPRQKTRIIFYGQTLHAFFLSVWIPALPHRFPTGGISLSPPGRRRNCENAIKTNTDGRVVIFRSLLSCCRCCRTRSGVPSVLWIISLDHAKKAWIEHRRQQRIHNHGCSHHLFGRAGGIAFFRQGGSCSLLQTNDPLQ